MTRLLDLGVPSYLLRSTLLGVLAQRLVRKLCKHCKKPVPTDPAQWQELVNGQRIEQPKQVYEAVGCLECRETGYLGRIGIYEMLVLTQGVKDAIRDDADPVQLREASIRAGMMPLRIAGSQKVWTGVTTVAEVMRTTPPPPPRDAEPPNSP